MTVGENVNLTLDGSVSFLNGKRLHHVAIAYSLMYCISVSNIGIYNIESIHYC